jgi:hypothetical protein
MSHEQLIDVMPPYKKGQAKKGQEINSIIHPTYKSCINDWYKFRYVWEGGCAFKEEYLERYSTRESENDFLIRKRVSYSPGHARTAVLETKNSIYERFIDISRSGGSQKYQDWVKGDKGGVDGAGVDMDTFIGTVCLPELLVTSRVGVFVDAPKADTVTKRDEEGFMPYAYVYKAEDIRTWAREGATDELSAVLLRDTVYTYDKDFGLIDGVESRYRLLKKTSKGVVIRFFNNEGLENENDRKLIEIPEIPFDFVEIDHSILNDVADHQIALLNLASGDLHYCMKANFPFYTEEFDAKTELDSFITQGDDFSDNPEGSEANAKESAVKTANVGIMNGRRYPKGTARPGFIHPSAEPLKASMSKQEEIRTEIRQLVMLSVSTLSPDAAKTERDDQGLEAGLSYIGLTLQALERRIARFFALYENQKNPDIASIKYPTDYKIRSEKDRREEADQLMEIMPKIPSPAYQREVSKRVAELTIGHWTDEKTMKKIDSEIDNAKIIVTDPEVLLADHEAGLVSDETASQARLYPEGEVEQAQKDHAARAKRILLAQTAGAGAEAKMGARGVDDLSADNNEAEDEKEISQSPILDPDGKTKTRGDAK